MQIFVPVCLLQENTTALTQGEQAVHTPGLQTTQWYYISGHTHNIINTIKTNTLSLAFELGTTDACVYQPYCCQLAERFEMARGWFFFSKICFQINIVPLFKETFFFSLRNIWSQSC